MSSDQVQGHSSTVVASQEAASGIIMGGGEPNRQAGSLGLQRTASKDLGAAMPIGNMPGSFGNASQGGGLGLQRTMSKDMSGNAQPVGGGLQRTMSRDLGAAGGQPGGLQRTMSRDLGAAGRQPGGLQRTMSRDLGGAGPQPGGLQRTLSRDVGSAAGPQSGGLQRTMSRGLDNAPSGAPQRSAARDGLRQPRKAPGVPRSSGGVDALPRQTTGST